jgi:hypothetical protein
VTIKFSGSLPTATPAANKKVAIELTDQNGIVFTAQVNTASFKQIQKAKISTYLLTNLVFGSKV